MQKIFSRLGGDLKCLTASQSVVDSASTNDYVGSEQQAIHLP